MRALFAIVCSALLCTCSSEPPLLDQILEEGQLRIVTRNAPTTFYYGPDAPRGIEFELAAGLAKRLGVDLSVQVAERFWQIMPAVESKTVHIGAAGLSVTQSRAERVDFGPAYQNSQQQIIYRRGTRRPRSLGDLAGASIEVVADSAYVRSLESARAEFPDLSWRENTDVSAEELVARVSRGEIDFTIVDSTIFELLRHYHPEARVAFGLGHVDSIAWAIPKGANRLREAVSAYFAEIQATGELDEILDRYYFAARNFNYVGARAFTRHVNARLPKYRAYFDQAEAESGFDWRLLAAIAYQESHWNPQAVSPTGVRGMMMLTEHTAEIVNVSDRHDAQESILGGARYLRRTLAKIPERIAQPDRLWLAVAAYNIGFGHLEDGRIVTEIRGGDPDSWDDVRENLPLLADEKWFSRVRRGYARGDAAVRYVDNVRRYYQLLHWAVGDPPKDSEKYPAQPLPPPGERPLNLARAWTVVNGEL